MKREAVRHTGTYPDIYLTDRSTMVLTLRTARQQVDSCRIVSFSRTVPEEKKYTEMHCAFRDQLFDYYQAELSPDKVARYQKYYFEITEKKKWYFSVHGVQPEPPRQDFFEFLYANSTGIVRPPEWSRGAVYYQIFPDRFCRAGTSADFEGCEEWGTLPTKENYMGGNLRGILDRLEYLEWLGVECIYLNPVFRADFNHKYATIDYFEIDGMFGDAGVFRQLVEEIHRRKMRIILDGVFNHTGIHFPPFQDILKRQENSSFTDWYHIKKYPVRVTEECYECVGDYKYMPKLNTGNPQVREFILRVMEYWIKEYHIDGWRLDVADEVDESVWLEARIRLKENDPQILLLGETWGSGFRLMDGLKMDGIMNYPFRDAVCDFFARGTIDAPEFDGRLQAMLAGYPERMDQAMFLPLDSHDTERFLYCCGGRRERMELAVIFQMMFVGAPSVYYGDEVGLTGGNDPDCRRCMVWEKEKQDQKLLHLYRKLIALRRRELCIKTGRYAVNLCERRLYGFVRFDDRHEIYTVINADDERKTVEVPVFYKKKHVDWESGWEYSVRKTGDRQYLNADIWNYRGWLQVDLNPMSAVIIISKEE